MCHWMAKYCSMILERIRGEIIAIPPLSYYSGSFVPQAGAGSGSLLPQAGAGSGSLLPHAGAGFGSAEPQAELNKMRSNIFFFLLGTIIP